MNKNIFLSLVLVLMNLLSVSLSESKGTVVVYSAGKPLITEERFQAEKKNLIEATPTLQEKVNSLNFTQAQEMDHALAEGLINQEVVDRYIAEKSIKQTREYQEEFYRILQSVTQMLNTKYFMKHISVTVSDADIKRYCEKNRIDLNIVAIKGGWKAMGLIYESEQEAKAEVAKAKSYLSEFIREEKRLELFTQEVTKLRNKYQIVINEGYFNK
jgi:hypothetical protein